MSNYYIILYYLYIERFIIDNIVGNIIDIEYSFITNWKINIWQIY